MRLLVPFGTRPEIIKLSPVVAALRDRGMSVRTVATGQHFSFSMADAFFEDLGLMPDVRWSPQPDGPTRLGAMLTGAMQELRDNRPDVVLVLGDTWTVPIFCMAARSEGVAVAHLEAGLRSFNDTSLEEAHRRLAGSWASLHFAPTELAARFLGREGVPPERIRIVGNPVLDVLRSRGVRARPVEQRWRIVVTAHRASNVDDPGRLEKLVEIVCRCAHEVGPVFFPIHPRTRDRLESSDAIGRLRAAGVQVLNPLSYAGMLQLLAQARVVLTDSGGLQEEAAWLGVPVVVLRRSTPRWESVAAGGAVLVGLDVARAVHAVTEYCRHDEQRRVASLPCPYGDGHTSQRVVDALTDPVTSSLLALREPDFVGQPVPA